MFKHVSVQREIRDENENKMKQWDRVWYPTKGELGKIIQAIFFFHLKRDTKPFYIILFIFFFFCLRVDDNVFG